MKSLFSSSMSLLVLFLSLSVMTERSFGQKMPPLPPGPPEQTRVDEGAVKKASEHLMEDCRVFLDRQTPGAQNSTKNKMVRETCFCIAKDIQRRQDLKEMNLISQHYRGQIANNAELTDVQNLHLHELDKLEQNCRRDSNYRFGTAEPRLEKSDKQSVKDQDQKDR